MGFGAWTTVTCSNPISLRLPGLGRGPGGDSLGGRWGSSSDSGALSSLTGQVVLSRSVEHQLRHPWDHSCHPSPHTSACGPRGHLGVVLGAGGGTVPEARQIGPAGRVCKRAGICMSSCPGLNAPLFLERYGGVKEVGGGILCHPWLEPIPQILTRETEAESPALAAKVLGAVIWGTNGHPFSEAIREVAPGWAQPSSQAPGGLGPAPPPAV